MKTTGLLMLTGLGLAMLSGCQTWVPEAGLTLPSGQYLDLPQYFPQSEPYPLANESKGQEEAAKQFSDNQRQ